MFSAGHGAEVVLVGNSFGSLISLLAASEQRPKGWRASTVGPVGPDQGQLRIVLSVFHPSLGTKTILKQNFIEVVLNDFQQHLNNWVVWR